MSEGNGTVAPRAQLVITLSAEGQVLVNGPIADRILCYGLLGLAHDLIRESASRAEGARLMRAMPRDVPPTPGVP